MFGKRVKQNGNGSNGSNGNGYHHLIDLRQVVKAYPTEFGDFIALKGVDLQVKEGEFVGVIGKSGSGKSTLINMITGLDRVTEGEVFIDGTAVHTLNEGQAAVFRGNHIGVVFQFFQLLPTISVIDNVMLPMDVCGTYAPREWRERALYLLDQVGIAEHADKLPSEVSGGQQQRVAIARALANNPSIVVADEPTGNLDSRTADQIFNLFEAMVDEGKTILVVTHDDELTRRFKRTIQIADGHVFDGQEAAPAA
jgi:putative ABC transport system ATP-binding protein